MTRSAYANGPPIHLAPRKGPDRNTSESQAVRFSVFECANSSSGCGPATACAASTAGCSNWHHSSIELENSYVSAGSTGQIATISDILHRR